MKIVRITQYFHFILFALASLCFFKAFIVHAKNTEQPLLLLREYKPIYFIVGKPDTKAQFSFMVQLFNKFDLYFAYSQLVMWDLVKPSSPLRDVNYNPEIFYRLYLKKESSRWIDLGIFEHESNGRDGEASRSWNRISLLYHSMQKLNDKVNLLWSVKIWFPLTGSSTKDLPRYRGIWELKMTLQNFLGPFFGENDLSLRLYPGGVYYTNPLVGGQELTLRTKAAVKALSPALVFQVFHGYAENLLEYKDKRWGLRAGVGF